MDAEKIWTEISFNQRRKIIAAVDLLYKKREAKKYRKGTIAEQILRLKFSKILSKTFGTKIDDDFYQAFTESEGSMGGLVTTQHKLDSAHEKLVTMRHKYMGSVKNRVAREKLDPQVFAILHQAEEIRHQKIPDFLIEVLRASLMVYKNLQAKHLSDEPEELNSPPLST